MQKALPFIMNLRNRTKDVGLALLKLDNLPLQNLRKVGKSTVGSSKDSNAEGTNCVKCKHLIEKSFSGERECMARVSREAKDDSRKDKLETIVEHPLVEAEPRVEGLDVPPKLLGSERFKHPLDRRLQKSFEVNKLKALDDLACKLMNLPASQIDSKLLDTCLSTRAVDFERTRTYPVVENFEGDINEHVRQRFDGIYAKDYIDSALYIDTYSNLTPLCYRSYDLHLQSECDAKTFKAEKSYPMHLDAEFKMSIERDIISDLNLSGFEPLRHEFIAYNTMLPPPLPPNETSISSRLKDGEEVRNSLRRDRTMPPYMREYKLGKKIQDPPTANARSEESYSNYLSTITSGSAAIQGTAGPRTASSADTKQQEVPLSQLLKQVRQKNRIAQEMQKKKFKFDPGRFFSKSTCFPPLDLRPKSATCPPKACPPRKKEAPPQKAMPCPPPKKSPCPPPKKSPCPVKTNPCDPCNPPPPCPPTKSPCGMYTGNKFKDTITLILCGFNPSNILRHAFGLPLLWNNSNNLVTGITAHCFSTTSVANAAAPEFKSKEFDLRSNREDVQDVYFARSFEPWAPIPSWPAPKKEDKKKMVCPGEGCRLPKVIPTQPSCKEFPCSFDAANRKR